MKSKFKKYALISVYDKTGLGAFAKELKKLKFEIISSGGTAKFLRKAGVRVIEVAKLTKYPHMLGGRVKTLHPLIHGGILADRTNKAHLKEIKKFKIRPFDVVVCNLYPFEEVISKKDFTHAEAIENIDIGGPAMVRASAKNHKNVAIVVDPQDYKKILEELKEKGNISAETRERLAFKAFIHTAQYDTLIVRYFSSRQEGGEAFPGRLIFSWKKSRTCATGKTPTRRRRYTRNAG